MQSSKRSRLGAVVVSMAGLLALGAGTASAQVVISQAYGGGGNSGATYKSDFIELFNRGTTQVSLNGWSVQYASSSGGSWAVTNLTNTTLQPGQYYLVKQADGTGGTLDLPQPDATGTVAMSGTAFKVALVSSTSALSGTCPLGGTVVDFVGAAGNCFEGAAAAPAPSNLNSVQRKNNGCQDTDENSADFIAAAPLPRNTASTLNTCTPAATDPVVSFSGATVSSAEGDTVANSLTFALEVAPAIASGETVTFDIAVSGPAGRYSYSGPASATLNDSTPLPYLIQVQTVANTLADGDATVTVTLSGFTGTDTTQADPIQKSGTIVDDDFPFTRISDIQGSGAFSPLDGQTVTTRGIVIGVVGQDFFLQSQPVDEDGNPQTSEGIYVYGLPNPPVSLAVGDFVMVTGKVAEYVPAAGAAPITELVAPVTVTKLGSGVPLPAPIELTAADVSSNDNQALEKYEFMRVRIADFVVTAPSGPGASDEFYGTVAGVARPFREPGVNLFACGVDPGIPGSKPLPVEAPSNVPCWDNNPELIRIKTNRLQGGAVVPVRTGATFANVTGVLDYYYSQRRWSILTRSAELAAPDTTDAETGTPVSDPRPTDITISGYNVENLAMAGGVAYDRKANKIARTIVEYLKTPDVLGLIEVANLATLQDIGTRVSAVAANDPQYEAVLLSNSGTQRLGFLLKKELVGGTARVTLVDAYESLADNNHVLCPDGVSYTAGLMNDRPPLVANLMIRGANGQDFPLTVINNHLKSLIDMDSMEDAEASYECFNRPDPPYTTYVPGGKGRGYRAKRQQNAEYTAMLVATLQAANPNQPIVLVGDFNAFQFNDGYGDLTNAIAGMPAANDETVVPGDGVDLVDPDLVVLASISPEPVYSYTFEGNAQALDQILVNEAALLRSVGLPRIEYARVNADFHQGDATNAGNAFGNSDHDPSLAFLDIASFRTADLDLEAEPVAATAQVGDTLEYAFTLVNDGPDDAANVTVELVLPAGVLFATLNAPMGWNCQEPQVGNAGTVTCNIDLMPEGDAQFAVTGTVGMEASSSTVTATLAAYAGSIDLTAPAPIDISTEIAAQLMLIFSNGFED